jgi:hypothetical protein
MPYRLGIPKTFFLFENDDSRRTRKSDYSNNFTVHDTSGNDKFMGWRTGVVSSPDPLNIFSRVNILVYYERLSTTVC